MIIFMGKTGKGDLQPRSYWKSRTLKGPVDSYCTEIEFDLLHLIPTHLRRMDSLINMGRQEIHACFFYLLRNTLIETNVTYKAWLKI